MNFPQGVSPDFSTIDGFDLFQPSEIECADRQQKLEERVKSDLRLKYCGRSIVKVDIQEPYTECTCSGRSDPLQYGRLRAVGRLASFFLGKSHTINYVSRALPEGVDESELYCVPSEFSADGGSWQLVISPDTSPEKPDQYLTDGHLVIELNDQSLAFAVGQPAFSSSDDSVRLLATSNFSLLDVCQNDNRSTCTYLAAQLSYISSPIGRKSVGRMFFDLGDGHAYVKLYSSVFEQNIFVKVPLSTVIDKKGRNIFSLPANQSRLVLSAEKACLGLNVFLEKELRGITNSTVDADYKDTFTSLLLNHVDSQGHPRLDSVNLEAAFNMFPVVTSCCDSPTESVVTIMIDATEHGPGSAWEYNKQLIALNIRYGVPVMLGTRKDWSGKKAAIKTGTPTGHAMAVLRDVTAVSKDGREIEGILVIDPYGESLNQDLATIAAEAIGDSGKFILDGQARSIQFVGWDAIPDRFEEAVIAKGGLRQLPS